MSSVRKHLADAVRRVNVAYTETPGAETLDVLGEEWRRLERQVEVAMASGDDRDALMAIAAWEQRAIDAFRGVSQ